MALPTTKERLGSPQRAMQIFALIMALVYLGLGGFFLYAASQPVMAGILGSLSPTVRLILGGVFTLYGLYRVVSVLRSLSAKTPSDELT